MILLTKKMIEPFIGGHLKVAHKNYTLRGEIEKIVLGNTEFEVILKWAFSLDENDKWIGSKNRYFRYRIEEFSDVDDMGMHICLSPNKEDGDALCFISSSYITSMRFNKNVGVM